MRDQERPGFGAGSWEATDRHGPALSVPARGVVTGASGAAGAAGTPDVTEVAGREAAPTLRVVLGLTAAASAFIGLLLYGGGLAARGPLDWFAWSITSPTTAILLGAGFVGAVPMLLYSATRVLWEEIRVPAIAATAVVCLLTAVTITHIRSTAAAEGELLSPAFLLAAAWLIGVGGLSLGALTGLGMQVVEPALPLPRIAGFPRWALPLIAVQGTALLGLGLGLLAKPAFWIAQLPWEVSDLDGRMIGSWCLALGLALLVALAEDDLTRVRGGLLGIAGIGALALVGLALRHGDVDWSGWAAPLGLALLAGLTATGFVGVVLARRATAAPA